MLAYQQLSSTLICNLPRWHRMDAVLRSRIVGRQELALIAPDYAKHCVRLKLAQRW